MRLVPVAAILLFALACAGCGKEQAPPASAPAPAPAGTPAPAASAPRPAAPAIEPGPARDAALAMGPGTCEQDVPAIRALPENAELGVDRHFDRILVHREAYKACLVAMVRDATAIADPGPEPKRNPFAAGDLAYELLAKLRYIQYGECVASGTTDRQAVSTWLAGTNPRRQLHRCLGKKLGM